MTPRFAHLLVPLLSVAMAACVAAAPPTPVSTPVLLPPQTATPPPSPTVPPTAVPTAIPPPPTQAPTAPPATPSLAPTAPPAASPTSQPRPTASPTPVDATVHEQLEQALEIEQNARGIPGMASVVIFGDDSRWAGTVGVADLDDGRRVSADTPFVVGSITKTFVAAAILQLVDEGRLDLDSRLARWLPEYPGATDITLRQLLNHTSGVFNYFEHPRYNSTVFGAPEETWTPAEILARFRRTGHFPPGQGFHYSNTGFILLGLVVEEVTGARLGEELRRRFFGPLGMNDTYFQGDGPPPPRSAQGYLRRQRGYREISDGTDYRPTTSSATVAWAAGAVVSSAHDIATWARALYGGELLSPESLAHMIDVAATPHAAGTYGLGTRTRLFQGARAFGHTGSLRGFMAAMWHFPEHDVTIVVLTNLGRIDANPIADRLADIALPGGP